MSQPFVSGTSLHGKYLIATIQRETFGIAAAKVREIIHLQKIKPIPDLPAYVKGVINLGSRIIPIVDLRLKLGLAVEYALRTCIVVVAVKVPSALTMHIGLIVDCVADVISLTEDQIEPIPSSEANDASSGLVGVAKIDGQRTTLLGLDHMVDTAVLLNLSPELANSLP